MINFLCGIGGRAVEAAVIWEIVAFDVLPLFAFIFIIRFSYYELLCDLLFSFHPKNLISERRALGVRRTCNNREKTIVFLGPSSCGLKPVHVCNSFRPGTIKTVEKICCSPLPAYIFIGYLS